MRRDIPRPDTDIIGGEEKDGEAHAVVTFDVDVGRRINLVAQEGYSEPCSFYMCIPKEFSHTIDSP